jgi:excisionase family DNA binding protein
LGNNISINQTEQIKKEMKMCKDNELQENVGRISTLLKAKEVAEILKVSRAIAYNLMLRGEIPAGRIGKCRHVRPEDLIKYIENNINKMNQYFE